MKTIALASNSSWYLFNFRRSSIDKLIEMGKIHKIESKNAFVACRSSDCEISKATAFSICESCEMVDEISDTKLSKYLSGFNHKKGMKFKRFNLEFFGICKKCKKD